MSDVALYRKYRPQTFAEVLGQDQVTRVLEASIKNGTVAHAYLFAGSRGTGKTSVARILASALKVTPEDLYEIDAASNRGIDEIRALREGVHTQPFRSPYKVYIIDEAHMLTKEAFNALLKTLEEPPAHVIFVLATTEPDKILDTIHSRCQVFTFKKPSRAVLKEVIADIAGKEKVRIEPSAVELIAALGDGSFRDTQSMLQKVMSSRGNVAITAADVELVAGAPPGDLLNAFIAALEERSLADALATVGKASSQNIDMELFMKLLLARLRAVLLLRFAKELAGELAQEYTDTDFAFLQSIAQKKSGHVSSATVVELLDAAEQMRFAAVPALPLELALMKLIGQDK